MKTLTVLVSTILLGSMALAQEPEMPDMTPPKEMEKLHALVGTWKGKEKHFDPGNTTPMEVDATITNKLTLGGHFLQGDYKTSIPGFGEFSGLQMISFDPATKKYVIYWFDSMSNTGLRGESTTMGPKFTFVTDEVEMPGMGKTKMRITTTTVNASSYTMTVEMTMGDSWHKFLDGTYTKQ
ncbi:MAG: DUF1579 family protein [Fimbriimonadales bacterium]